MTTPRHSAAADAHNIQEASSLGATVSSDQAARARRGERADIVVRVAMVQDAPRLHEIYAPYVRDTAVTFEYEPPTLAAFTERLERTLERHPYLVAERFAPDGSSRIVGYVYASPFKDRPAYDWAVETSIYVDRDERRGGVGRTMHNALECALREQGILNMEACIATTRTPDEHLTNDSMYFHERMGYRLVGEFSMCGYKYGRWYDMIWMEKHIASHEAKQPHPVPFPQVRAVLAERYGIA